MNREVRVWLDIAEQDYGVAKHLYKTYYPRPIEIICYHCQQAAEKAIKAVILGLDVNGGVPKSHDLSFLLNQIKNKVEISEEIYEFAEVLTPFGTSVRYPNELFLENHHAEKAIQGAGSIILWAKNAIDIDDEETGSCPL